MSTRSVIPVGRRGLFHGLGLALLIVSIASCWVARATTADALGSMKPIELGRGVEEVYAPSLEYLLDPDKRMTLAEVIRRNRDFVPQPQGRDLTFGYRTAAVWIRLPVRIAPGSPSEWRLEIAYPPLDHIDVYLPNLGKQWRGGDQQPVEERALLHFNHVFPLSLSAGEHVIYVRVESDSTMTIPIAIRSAQAFHRYTAHGYLWMGIYYGVLLALALYNLMLFVTLRLPAYGYYVGWVLVLAVALASLNGIGAQHLWHGWVQLNSVALPIFFMLSSAMATAFAQTFLDTRTRLPRVHWLLSGLIVFYLICAMLMSVLSRQTALQLMSIVVFFAAVALAVVAGVALVKKIPGAGYYAIAWVAVLVSGLVLPLRNFGWLDNSFWMQYSMQIGAAIEMVLLSFALADRFARTEREKKEAEAEAFVAQAAALESLRRNEMELERRVADRTTALAAANARLAESESRLREIANRDTLTGLANRRALEDHLDAAVKRAARRGEPLALMVIDLDGFKEVNDGYGHAAGDALLQEVAERLRQVVRATDLVARLGGDEFVVVLESPQSLESAGAVADKLIRDIAAPVIHQSQSLRVGASVGIALQEAGATDVAMLLRRADRAMYAAKEAGRGCWRAWREPT